MLLQRGRLCVGGPCSAVAWSMDGVSETWDLAEDRDVKQGETEAVNEAPPTPVGGFSLNVT